MGRAGNMVINIMSGKITKQSHHCVECGRPGNDICLAKKHQAHCEECGYIFNVMTRGGCAKHKYRDGYNKSHILDRKGLDPNFNADGNGVEDVDPTETPQAEVETRPYNTDWSKAEYKVKPEPKQKLQDKQGKKQQPAKTIKDFKKDRRTKYA